MEGEHLLWDLDVPVVPGVPEKQTQHHGVTMAGDNTMFSISDAPAVPYQLHTKIEYVLI